MKLLVVEDDPRIKTEVIDDCLESLGHVSDWADNQQDANGLLAANEYDLILQDLQIPSRPGGMALAEYGKNLLRQARARKGRDVPIILMTAQHQDCVDLMIELLEIGLDGSISKPFPMSGRTLAVVIEEVLAKHRRYRLTAKRTARDGSLTPFLGGVLVYYPNRVELCGEIIAEKSRRGLAWQILQVFREMNAKGRFVRLGSQAMMQRLDPMPEQNTLIRAICSLRNRIAKIMRDRLGLRCGTEDVIGKDDQGYHLQDTIIVEVHDENGTEIGKANSASRQATPQAASDLQLSEKHRWIMDGLASGRKLTRRDVEQTFGISSRTAKRLIGELSNAGLIDFDRSTHPGFYRLK